MLRIRAFRRRWFLALFAFIFVLFLLIRSLEQVHIPTSGAYDVEHTLLRQPFQWHPRLSDVETANITTCRNSVQGSQLIVDERGYVCSRGDLTSGGCCEGTASQYNCSSCKANGCCMFYEHCVSCCLHPEKQPLLEKVLKEARQIYDKLIVSASDQFELCLAKCRTSSKSVQHENSYRDPHAKHCYGESPPDLQMALT
ncbi:SPRNG-like protein [Mya arenaria]|uniref:SREBP regulating gene protein n=1 Tax=Mya arenaria TaxID=6604 RepID=A0ABY7E640_MYAAR|nr:SREBP regulating gene protein-like [Mya arenaria]WAR02621.1 SPRNG-like protein [Mya arenaria]